MMTPEEQATYAAGRREVIGLVARFAGLDLADILLPPEPGYSHEENARLVDRLRRRDHRRDRELIREASRLLLDRKRPHRLVEQEEGQDFVEMLRLLRWLPEARLFLEMVRGLAAVLKRERRRLHVA